MWLHAVLYVFPHFMTMSDEPFWIREVSLFLLMAQSHEGNLQLSDDEICTSGIL
jgi:hypothetical protein